MKVLNEASLIKIISTAEDYMNFLNSDTFAEDEIENYETVLIDTIMNELYGQEFFDVLNRKMGEEEYSNPRDLERKETAK